MNRILISIVLFGALLFAIGCSAVAPAAAPAMRQGKTGDIIPGAPPAPMEAYDSDGSGGRAQPTAAPASGEANESGLTQAEERMIVYTGVMSLQVKDAADTINKIQTILAGVNGYISSRSVVEYAENKLRGTVMIRVPAVQLEPTLAQIRALGVKVLKETQDSNDVTAEFTDLDARRKNLEAYEVELQKLLETVRERTGKAEDILAVYNQLTQVRGEIEQIKGRQNYLQNTSALATYTIDLVPVEEVVVQGDPGWNPGTTVSLALDRLVTILQGLADVAINLAIIVLPVLLILAIPFVILLLVVRALIKRRTPKKPATA